MTLEPMREKQHHCTVTGVPLRLCTAGDISCEAREEIIASHQQLHPMPPNCSRSADSICCNLFVKICLIQSYINAWVYNLGQTSHWAASRVLLQDPSATAKGLNDQVSLPPQLENSFSFPWILPVLCAMTIFNKSSMDWTTRKIYLQLARPGPSCPGILL